MPYRDAADHVGPEGGPLVGVLTHKLLGSFWVGAAALHDLDEAGLIWVAMQVESHIVAVLKGRPALEQLLGLRPPFALLRTIAIAAGRLLGLETDNRDESAVVGHPRCGA